jgi:hypothetical protein
MAFKRSAVRSRISPPEIRQKLRFLPYFFNFLRQNIKGIMPSMEYQWNKSHRALKKAEFIEIGQVTF